MVWVALCNVKSKPHPHLHCDLTPNQAARPTGDQPQITDGIVHARDRVTAIPKRKIYKYCDTKGKCSYWDQGMHKLDCIADEGGPALKCKPKDQPKSANSGSSKPPRNLHIIKEIHGVSGRTTYQDCQLGQCSHYDELGRPLDCRLVEGGSKELNCTLQEGLPLNMANAKSHDAKGIRIARIIQENAGTLGGNHQALLRALDAALPTANRSNIIVKRNPDLLQCNQAFGELMCLAQYNGPPPRKYQCESSLPVTPTSFICKAVDLFKKAKRETASSTSKSGELASRQVVRRQCGIARDPLQATCSHVSDKGEVQQCTFGLDKPSISCKVLSAATSECGISPSNQHAKRDNSNPNPWLETNWRTRNSIGKDDGNVRREFHEELANPPPWAACTYYLDNKEAYSCSEDPETHVYSCSKITGRVSTRNGVTSHKEKRSSWLPSDGNFEGRTCDYPQGSGYKDCVFTLKDRSTVYCTQDKDSKQLECRSQAAQKGKVERRQLADPASSGIEPTLSWIPSLTVGSPVSAQSSRIQEFRMMMDGEIHCSFADGSSGVGLPTTTPAASSLPASASLGDPLGVDGQIHHSHTTPSWESDYPLATPTHECYIDFYGQKHCSSAFSSETAEGTDYPTPTHRPHKQKPKYEASKCLENPDGTEQCWHLTFDDHFVVCNRSRDQEQYSCESYVGRVVKDPDYNTQRQQESTTIHEIRKRNEVPVEESQDQEIDRAPIFDGFSRSPRGSKHQHADLNMHHLAKLFEFYQHECHRHGLPESVMRDMFTDLQIHLSSPPPPPSPTEGSCHPILHHRVHCTFPLPTPSNPKTTITCATYHHRRVCYDKMDKHARFATAIEARRHGNCYETDDGRAECTFEREIFQQQRQRQKHGDIGTDGGILLSSVTD